MNLNGTNCSNNITRFLKWRFAPPSWGKKFKSQKKLQIKFNFEHPGQTGQKLFAHNSVDLILFAKGKERSSIISEKNTVIIFQEYKRNPMLSGK